VNMTCSKHVNKLKMLLNEDYSNRQNCSNVGETEVIMQIKRLCSINTPFV
jgi:hypothetical protein